MKVYAPGKLILSGEHAVVYGNPALAMAVNRYVTATITRERRPQIAFDLADLAHHSRLSFNALNHLKERVKKKYYRFVRGEYSIRQVLQKPFELAQFALGTFAEALNFSLPHGIKLHVQSDIPMGCGLGSSAATILSVIYAIAHHLQISLSEETLFQLALEAENMQHGYSSGLDLRVSLQGGCIYMEGEIRVARSVPVLPMFLINTGSPQTTTGQCVEKVAPHFTHGLIGNDFAAVTKAMDQALQQQDREKLYASIRDNHRLLTEIGVVPSQIQQFVQEIEAFGGVAKICGAGAVAGDAAGALWVVTENAAAITELCTRYRYSFIPLAGEARGVHVV